MDTAESQNAPRLALSQLRRIRRIVDAAVDLAEQGGFDGVRLRDLAEASGVSLGTLYKYFHSKEDILVFAVNEGSQALEQVMAERPPKGDSAHARVTELFARATRGLVRQPGFARAALRSIASGDQSMAIPRAGFHLRMSRLIIAALRGEAPDLERDLSEPVGNDWERQVAQVLEHVWFASLLGWSNGLHPVKAVEDHMKGTIRLLLENR